MKWNLNVEVDQKETFKKLHHQDKLVLLGSCFSENISQILKRLKFSVEENPFGILYNPKSILKALNYILDKKQYHLKELFKKDDIFYSLDHHSSYSDIDADKTLELINSSILEAHSQLLNAQSLVITFGTAFYFEFKEDNRVVGNCHKLPASNFNRIRDNAADIVSEYTQQIKSIKLLNPDIQIVFTVSPIRHWKNGASDNNWSKSILIDAVRSLVEQFSYVHYFPSFEIMMDELRDHRFYKEDLLHPNQQAIQHIWGKFKENCVEDSEFGLLNEVEQLVKASEHKPFNFENELHQKFIATTQQKMDDLQLRFSYLNFEQEKFLLNTPK